MLNSKSVYLSELNLNLMSIFCPNYHNISGKACHELSARNNLNWKLLFLLNVGQGNQDLHHAERDPNTRDEMKLTTAFIE